MEQESARAEPRTKPQLESRPELTSHFKKRDEGKNFCTGNEPNKAHLSGNEKGAQGNVGNERKNDKNGTFWTVCPYCYYMYEYVKVFEERCLLCQNCRRAFHGVAVVEPNKNMLVEGKDEYYCGLGYFSLKYSLNGDQKEKIIDGEGKSYNVGTVVEISDDDDDGAAAGGKGGNGKSGEVAKEDVLMGYVKGVMQGTGKTEVGSDGKRVVARKNVKSVPRNSKKVMGRGVKSRKIVGGMGIGGSACGIETGGDGCVSDLDFIEKDGDVFVGVKSTFNG